MCRKHFEITLKLNDALILANKVFLEERLYFTNYNSRTSLKFKNEY